MTGNTNRRNHEQYRWKVFIFFWASLAFIFGYIFGVISALLGEESGNGGFGRFPVDENPKAVSLFAFLTIGILSGYQNSIKRQAIRETWLSRKPSKDVHHTFVLGIHGLKEETLKVLLDEKEVHKDLLLLEDIRDSYSLLTHKLLDYFKWLDGAVNFTFLLKADDDSFVNLDRIHNELSERSSKSGLYWGFFDGRAHVKKKGQWAENNWILCDRYLPYAEGGGYVLSSDLVHFIAKNSVLLQLYNSEDVSLGAWLAPLKINRVHDPRFDTEYESRGCFNTYLITHKQSPSKMREKFSNIINTGVMCNPEFRSKKSYVYNWNVLPSLCCVRNSTRVP